MIFQPSGGTGSGEGLTVYNGTVSGRYPKTFETPVKLVFVSSYNSDTTIWYIILPGKEEAVYGVLGETWPPERLDYVRLSGDGKTLSCTGTSRSYLYYAIS